MAIVRLRGDAQLFRKAQRGDEAAFNRLVRYYTPLIKNIIRRLTPDRDEVDELTWKVWATVWFKKGQFRFGCTLTTWLYAVARTETWMLGRTKIAPKARHFVSVEHSELPLVIDHDNPEAICARRSELRQASRILRKIPAHYRRVGLMLLHGGLDKQEAARHSGLTYPAVKSRAYRCKIILLKRIANEDEYDKEGRRGALGGCR